MKVDSQRHVATGFRALGILLLALAVSACDNLLAQEPAPVPSTPASGITLLDAVRSTLVNQPLLRIQEQQVNISRGIKQQASGQFDTSLGSSVIQSRTNTPLTLYLKQQALLNGTPTNDLVTNLTTYNANAGKLFRSGISASIVLGVTRDLDNITQGGGINGSHLGLVVNIPLLRGLGSEAVAAQEGEIGRDGRCRGIELVRLIAPRVGRGGPRFFKIVAGH